MLGFGALGEFALGEISKTVADPPVTQPPTGAIDLSWVSANRIVVFEGSGSRVVIF
jgi:hypothetical protein